MVHKTDPLSSPRYFRCREPIEDVIKAVKECKETMISWTLDEAVDETTKLFLHATDQSLERILDTLKCTNSATQPIQILNQITVGGADHQHGFLDGLLKLLRSACKFISASEDQARAYQPGPEALQKTFTQAVHAYEHVLHGVNNADSRQPAPNQRDALIAWFSLISQLKTVLGEGVGGGSSMNHVPSLAELASESGLQEISDEQLLTELPSYDPSHDLIKTSPTSCIGEVSDDLRRNRLDRLRPLRSVIHDQWMTSTDEVDQAQEKIISEIFDWANDRTPSYASRPVFWMHGEAKTGKTAIARGVALRAHREHQLLASFSFSRAGVDRQDAVHLVPTVMYQIAHFDKDFFQRISDAIAMDRDIRDKSTSQQITSLLKRPFLDACGPKSSSPPVMIVLDALDVCDPWDDPEVAQAIILFVKALSALPLRVKILITSRYTQGIEKLFEDPVLATYTSSIVHHHIQGNRLSALANDDDTSPPGQSSLSISGEDDIYDNVNTVQHWLDQYLEHPYRIIKIQQLLDLAAKSNNSLLLPFDFFVPGVCVRDLGMPMARGSIADVYQGTYKGQLVAVKHFCHITPSEETRNKLHRRFLREALIWRQLRHPRLLSFLGIDHNAYTTRSAWSMVSPWMPNGTLMDYLKAATIRGSRVSHGLLMDDIASGLKYLHDQLIAHGDLHGSNIYIDQNERAKLGDFGLADVTHMAHLAPVTTINKAGAVRWLAPELIDGEEGAPPPRKTLSGDIFAFGRVCYSIFTRFIPSHTMQKDVTVLLKVMQDVHLSRPTLDACHGTQMSDRLWDLVLRCWRKDPLVRPNILQVEEALIQLRSDVATQETKPAPANEEQIQRHAAIDPDYHADIMIQEEIRRLQSQAHTPNSSRADDALSVLGLSDHQHDTTVGSSSPPRQKRVATGPTPSTPESLVKRRKY